MISWRRGAVWAAIRTAVGALRVGTACRRAVVGPCFRADGEGPTGSRAQRGRQGFGCPRRFQDRRTWPKRHGFSASRDVRPGAPQRAAAMASPSATAVKTSAKECRAAGNSARILSDTIDIRLEPPT